MDEVVLTIFRAPYHICKVRKQVALNNGDSIVRQRLRQLRCG
jgi:hypothetical protein